jgi:short-subunit dehydrogenase
MLTHALLPGMLQRRRGRIMLVGSVGGFLPGPYLAVYYATKAYVLSFGEALSEELRGSGVTVSVLAPGPTTTEFQAVAGLGISRVSSVTPMMSAAAVARIGYNGMKANKVVVVPGPTNKLSTLLIKFMPRAVTRRLIGVLQARR